MPERALRTPTRRPAPRRAALLLAPLLLAAAGCERGPQGPPGPPPGTTTDTDLAPHEVAPSIVVTVLGVGGASGAGGAFRTGDRLSVRFTLTKDDGSPWLLSEMVAGLALASGPTFNYQRVLTEETDVVDRAAANGDGSYTYEFPAPIPPTYQRPHNDTAAFGPGDGEMTGQPLLDGTYTVGLSFAWAYQVGADPFLQVGEAVRDFPFGGTATCTPREVVKQDNCNQCHVELQAHAGRYRTVRLCLLCHTAGAEDLNDPTLGGGTPGVTVSSRVLFHRIHNAQHLPSVLGVATNPDGSRDYAAAPRPLLVAGSASGLRDFSAVGFPVWPNRTEPMARDFGWSALTPAQQALEDRVRTGVSTCFVCHGDPDGAGPLTAPAQGDTIVAQPTRSACGACHDDVDWDLPYVANAQTMPPQPDDTQCVFCHDPLGGPLAASDGHRHPLSDPFFNPGLNLDLVAVAEAGAHDADGTLDPGEKVALAFTVRDDAGADVPPGQLTGVEAALSGPTTNLQLLNRSAVPTALLSGPQPFQVLLPERIELEFAGDATAAAGDVFTTAAAPHYDLPAAPTTVYARTATAGGASVLAVSSAPPQSHLDVLDAAGFARDDWVVVDDGVAGAEEYLRVQLVEGDRLWFSAPNAAAHAAGTRRPHPAGATVLEVALAPLAAGVDYALDAAAGTVTELVELGAGTAVVVSYSTDWVVPASYTASPNASPDVDGTAGEWDGLALVDGTYTVGVWAWRDALLNFAGEDSPYRIASTPATRDVLVGGAFQPEPWSGIDSGASCNACHQDLQFHGGTFRGFDTCLLCHGTSGAEDLPRYVAANAPATPGTAVGFRSLLHKIHHGRALDAGAAFRVVGAGPAPYPDNFEVNDYADILFPAQPGATMRCSKCHGPANTAWLSPAPRDHPLGPSPIVRVWSAACGSCHDSPAAQAHIASQTAPDGSEACAICHDPGEDEAVDVVHLPR